MGHIVRRATGSYTVLEDIDSMELWERLMLPFTAGAEIVNSTWIDMMFSELEPQEDGTFIGRGLWGNLYPIKVVCAEPGRFLSYRWGNSLNPPAQAASHTVEFVHADYSYTIAKRNGRLVVEGEYTSIFRRLRARTLRMRIFGHRDFDFPPSARFENVLSRIPAEGRLDYVKDLE